MKKIIFMLLILLTIPAFSQNQNKSIYSGGMLFLQPGYSIAKTQHKDINSHCWGVGGIVRIYFHKYFTAGIYGGTQKTNYNTTNSENSYLTLGYGGGFVGLSHKKGKYRYTVSGFIGGGAFKNLHIDSENNNILTEAYLYKSSSIIVSPILSVDYSLTERLQLTCQAICLYGKYNDNPFYNPFLQLGILFGH
jgi:hypothetical protein